MPILPRTILRRAGFFCVQSGVLPPVLDLMPILLEILPIFPLPVSIPLDVLKIYKGSGETYSKGMSCGKQSLNGRSTFYGSKKGG